MQRRNKNRGYQDLRVWQDAVALYGKVCRAYRPFPFELKKVASQAMASCDSVHRNIAEGYCRRTLNEYLVFLNYALGSLGEAVSGFAADKEAENLTPEGFEELDALAYRIENGLLKMVDALEAKRYDGPSVEGIGVHESNAVYGAD